MKRGGSDQTSFYDRWRMFKEEKKKAVDGGMAVAEKNKKRGRLNKIIHHWGKGINLIEGPVKERDNLRGVKVKIW